MTALPNATVPLVDKDGRATSALLDFMPSLSALDVVVDERGGATSLFRSRLAAVARTALPGVMAQLTDSEGRPTRVFTAILMGMR